MARATFRDTDALQVDGLNETLRGLAKADRTVAKEVKGLIRVETKKIALEARKVDAGHSSEPSNKTRMIGWSVTNKGAGIRLRASREPRAYMTEFGAETQPVGFESEDMYNRPQDTLRGGRTTLGWTGNKAKVLNSNAGYVIQPTIRERLPKFIDNLGDSILTYYDRLVEKGR